jgi:hypothetical protein
MFSQIRTMPHEQLTRISRSLEEESMEGQTTMMTMKKKKRTPCQSNQRGLEKTRKNMMSPPWAYANNPNEEQQLVAIKVISEKEDLNALESRMITGTSGRKIWQCLSCHL